MQVYVYPSTWTGGTEADTLGRLDSLFTVDMDLDGVMIQVIGIKYTKSRRLHLITQLH